MAAARQAGDHLLDLLPDAAIEVHVACVYDVAWTQRPSCVLLAVICAGHFRGVICIGYRKAGFVGTDAMVDMYTQQLIAAVDMPRL